jgi:hypothetical protein
MSFWKKLLGIKPAGPNVRQVDWTEVEASWRAIEVLVATDNQINAKQALIQADVLVDSIMKQAGVGGGNFGERLKTLRPRLSPAVYRQLWQAHIKRNELVHEAGSFVAGWEREQYLRAFKDAIAAMRGMR